MCAHKLAKLRHGDVLWQRHHAQPHAALLRQRARRGRLATLVAGRQLAVNVHQAGDVLHARVARGELDRLRLLLPCRRARRAPTGALPGRRLRSLGRGPRAARRTRYFNAVHVGTPARRCGCVVGGAVEPLVPLPECARTCRDQIYRKMIRNAFPGLYSACAWYAGILLAALSRHLSLGSSGEGSPWAVGRRQCAAQSEIRPLTDKV
mmetsp:Transcript_46869/g.118598  ORF Transcript_46869/g.118598 Transcript_46869/m.118598 type:complete len:207 (-) Transcript_46869:142-762(-)